MDQRDRSSHLHYDPEEKRDYERYSSYITSPHQGVYDSSRYMTHYNETTSSTRERDSERERQVYSRGNTPCKWCGISKDERNSLLDTIKRKENAEHLNQEVMGALHTDFDDLVTRLVATATEEGGVSSTFLVWLIWRMWLAVMRTCSAYIYEAENPIGDITRHAEITRQKLDGLTNLLQVKDYEARSMRSALDKSIEFEKLQSEFEVYKSKVLTDQKALYNNERNLEEKLNRQSEIASDYRRRLDESETNYKLLLRQYEKLSTNDYKKLFEDGQSTIKRLKSRIEEKDNLIENKEAELKQQAELLSQSTYHDEELKRVRFKLEEDIKEKEAIVQRLEMDNDSLIGQMQMVKLEKTAGQADNLNAMEALKHDYKGEVVYLKGILVSTNEKAQAAEDRNKSLSVQVNTLKQKLSEANHQCQLTNDLQSQLAGAEEKNGQLQSDLESCQNQLAMAEEINTQSQSELESLQVEYKKQRAMTNVISTEFNRIDTHLKDANDTIQRQTQKILNFRFKINDLEKERDDSLQSVTTITENFERSQRECQELRVEIQKAKESLEREAARSQETETDLEKVREDMEAREEKIRIQESDLAALKAMKKELEIKKDEVQATISNCEMEYNKLLETAAAERMTLLNQVNFLERDTQSATFKLSLVEHERNKLQEECKDLTKVIQDLRSELDQAVTALDSEANKLASKSRQDVETSDFIQKLEIENSELQHEIKVMGKEIDKVKHQMVINRKEFDRRGDVIDKMEAANYDLQVKYNQLDVNNKGLMDEYNGMKEKLATTADSLRVLREQLEEKSEINYKLNERIRQLGLENNQLKHDSEDINQLRAELAESKKLQDDLRIVIDNMTCEIEQAHMINDQLESVNSERELKAIELISLQEELEWANKNQDCTVGQESGDLKTAQPKENVEKEPEIMNQDVRKMKAALEESHIFYNAVTDNLREQLEALQKEKDDLMVRLNKTASNVTEKVAPLDDTQPIPDQKIVHSEIDHLRDQLQVLQDEKDDLLVRLSEMQKKETERVASLDDTQPIADQQVEAMHSEMECKEHVDIINDLRNDLEECKKDYEERLTNMNEKIASLASQLDSAAERFKEMSDIAIRSQDAQRELEETLELDRLETARLIQASDERNASLIEKVTVYERLLENKANKSPREEQDKDVEGKEVEKSLHEQENTEVQTKEVDKSLDEEQDTEVEEKKVDNSPDEEKNTEIDGEEITNQERVEEGNMDSSLDSLISSSSGAVPSETSIVTPSRRMPIALRSPSSPLILGFDSNQQPMRGDGQGVTEMFYQFIQYQRIVPELRETIVEQQTQLNEFKTMAEERETKIAKVKGEIEYLRMHLDSLTKCNNTSNVWKQPNNHEWDSPITV